MDARSLRRMTLGHRVITGGSHAPTPSYPQPQPSPPPRRRAPASPSEVQGLQAQDLGSGPLSSRQNNLSNRPTGRLGNQSSMSQRRIGYFGEPPKGETETRDGNSALRVRPQDSLGET